VGTMPIGKVPAGAWGKRKERKKERKRLLVVLRHCGADESLVTRRNYHDQL